MSTKFNLIYRLLAILVITSLLLMPTSNSFASTNAVLITGPLLLDQPIPPPLGPPEPREPVEFLAVDTITILVKNTINGIVNNLNTDLAQGYHVEGDTGWPITIFGREIHLGKVEQVDVRAKITWSLQQYSWMASTQNSDRPNERFVNIPYSLSFDVHDIEERNSSGWIPIKFERTISMTINIQAFCSQWNTGRGQIKIMPAIDQPYLENDQSIPEQIINTFLLNYLTPYIDSEVRKSLQSFGTLSIPGLDLIKECDSLGLREDQGGNDQIFWSFHPVTHSPNHLNRITVKLIGIKRLAARGLYNDVEMPAVELYANYQHSYTQIPSMREGDQVTLQGPTMTMDRTFSTEPWILIANVIIPSNSYIPYKDSTFLAFDSSTNFGNGTQRLIVDKSYWTTGEKPLKTFLPGYELIFEVDAPNPEGNQ